MVEDGGRFVAQAAQGMSAAGVVGEGLTHERGSLGIEFDSADFPIFEATDDIAVAERHPVRRATLAALFGGALQGFGCQVAAVELVDRGQHAMEQLTGGRVVDVLGDGDQVGAGLADGQANGDVVVQVAG